MKNIYLLCLFMAITPLTKAQDTVKKVIKTYKWRYDKNSIVKDSSGRQYPYAEWQPLSKSGKYIIRPVDMENINDQFIIVKIKPRPVNGALQKATYSEQISPYAVAREIIKVVDTSLWPRAEETTCFKTGEEMKSFSERDIGGNKLSLKKLRGKVVVINFWFIGCQPCRKEIPDLDKVAALYKNNPDVVFIALALDDSDNIKNFLRQLAFYDVTFGYHIIADARAIANHYGVQLYPTNVILDRDGKIASHWVGYSPSAPYWMKKSINESLNKKTTGS